MINTYTYLYDCRKNSRREQIHLNDCHFNLNTESESESVYRTVINGDVAYGTAGNRSTILIDINQAQGVHTVDRLFITLSSHRYFVGILSVSS